MSQSEFGVDPIHGAGFLELDSYQNQRPTTASLQSSCSSIFLSGYPMIFVVFVYGREINTGGKPLRDANPVSLVKKEHSASSLCQMVQSSFSSSLWRKARNKHGFTRHTDFSDWSPMLRNGSQQLSGRCIGGASTPTPSAIYPGSVTHRKYQDTSLKRQAFSCTVKSPGQVNSYSQITIEISQRAAPRPGVNEDWIGVHMCVFVVRTCS